VERIATTFETATQCVAISVVTNNRPLSASNPNETFTSATGGVAPRRNEDAYADQSIGFDKFRRDNAGRSRGYSLDFHTHTQYTQR
jgi:hypothetical protein